MVITLKISVDKCKGGHYLRNSQHHRSNPIWEATNALVVNPIPANDEQSIYQVIKMTTGTPRNGREGRWILSMTSPSICSESVNSVDSKHTILGKLSYRWGSMLREAKKDVLVTSQKKFTASGYMCQMQFTVRWGPPHCFRSECKACQIVQLCVMYQTNLEQSEMFMIPLSRKE